MAQYKKHKQYYSFLKATCIAAVVFDLSASPAHAQSAPDPMSSSSLEMYGLIGEFVDSLKLSGAPKSTAQVGGGGLVTSYWGIRGSEDIGGGNSVIFGLESFFRPNNGEQGRSAADPFFSRNAFVGLSGSFGTVKFGRQTNPTYLNQQLVNPFGSSVVFSPLIVQSYVASFHNTEIGDTVWNNAISYTSPTVDGLTGTVIYGVSSTPGQQGDDNTGLHLTYANGPLTVVFSAQRDRVSAIAPSTGQYLYLGGAAYNAGFVKVYGAVQTTSDNNVETGSHTYELGVSVPITSVSSFLAEWARTKQTAPLVHDTIHNTGTAAYDYHLSKRTDVYLIYSYDKLESLGSGSTFGLGYQTTF